MYVIVEPLQLHSLLLSLQSQILGHGVDVAHDVAYYVNVLLSLIYYILHVLSVLSKLLVFVSQLEAGVFYEKLLLKHAACLIVSSTHHT